MSDPIEIKPPQNTATPTVAEVEASGAIPATAKALMVPDGMMRIDLHCHSEASSDCKTPIVDMAKRCIERGISVQAITDHNEIWGAQKLKSINTDPNLTIIVGEEVSTREGEIVGLFLKEKIPPGLSAEETVSEIKSQGGLVLIPHGFDPLKRHRITPMAVERIAEQIDIIETFNAHISNPRWNRRAKEWAEAHKKLQSGGSDAHTLARMGSAWVQTPYKQILSPEDLKQALQTGVVMGEWTHPAIAFVQKMWDFARRGLQPKKAT